MPRPKVLQKLTIGDLEKLLREKHNHLDELMEQRRELMAQLRQVDREIRRMKGNVRVSARRRRLGQKPLRAYIREVLAESRKPLTPKEVEQGVRDAGYKSKSSKFYIIVHQNLNQMVKAGEVEKDSEKRTYRLVKS
jgi:hypothetical protein